MYQLEILELYDERSSYSYIKVENGPPCVDLDDFVPGQIVRFSVTRISACEFGPLLEETPAVFDEIQYVGSADMGSSYVARKHGSQEFAFWSISLRKLGEPPARPGQPPPWALRRQYSGCSDAFAAELL